MHYVFGDAATNGLLNSFSVGVVSRVVHFTTLLSAIFCGSLVRLPLEVAFLLVGTWISLVLSKFYFYS